MGETAGNLMDRDEMTQQISPTETVNLIDLLADFAERSRGIVMLIMKSLNYYSLKLISSHAQSQYKKGLLRLWTCLMAYDPQMQEDHLQNLTQFLFSFLRRDAEMHPGDEDILRVEFLLTLACFTKNSARIRLRDSEVHKLIVKHLRSPLWKLQCWTCLLLSQLCFECNELKEFLISDLRKSLVNPSQSSDLLDLLSNPQPEVRAAALLLLESFVGFGSSGYQGTRNSIHVYLNHDELNKLVETEDQSAKFDQLLLNRIAERISMNREGSVLVRRELMRLILKVFCRRCHMAHTICFVDRILKGEMEVTRLLDLLDADRRSAPSPPSDFNPFYVKYWILFLYLRDAEPNLTIRNAVSHYIYVICKNVDYLKSSGTLPSTRSIFDLAAALKFGPQAKSVSTASLPTLRVASPFETTIRTPTGPSGSTGPPPASSRLQENMPTDSSRAVRQDMYLVFIRSRQSSFSSIRNSGATPLDSVVKSGRHIHTLPVLDDHTRRIRTDADRNHRLVVALDPDLMLVEEVGKAEFMQHGARPGVHLQHDVVVVVETQRIERGNIARRILRVDRQFGIVGHRLVSGRHVVEIDVRGEVGHREMEIGRPADPRAGSDRTHESFEAYLHLDVRADKVAETVRFGQGLGDLHLERAVVEPVVGGDVVLREMLGSGHAVALPCPAVFQEIAPANHFVAAGEEVDIGSLILRQGRLVVFGDADQCAVVGRIDIYGHLLDLIGKDIGRAVTDIPEPEHYPALTVIPVLPDAAIEPRHRHGQGK